MTVRCVTWLSTAGGSPVQDPPNQPKHPPVEEPGETPPDPPPFRKPPMGDPDRTPKRPPVEEPPERDNEQKVNSRTERVDPRGGARRNAERSLS